MLGPRYGDHDQMTTPAICSSQSKLRRTQRGYILQL